MSVARPALAVPRPVRLGRSPEALLVASGGLSAAANYGYTLAVLWLLPARQYVVFGSVAALFLLCGTIASASTPWVLAREVTRAPAGSDRRARAVSFGLVSVVVQGLAAGAAAGAVAAHYASTLTVVVVLGTCLAIFVEAAGIGYLQGLERFGLIAALRVTEVGVKVVAGLALVVVGVGAIGAVTGFLLGAAIVMFVGVTVMRGDLRWVAGALWDRTLWTASRGLLGIQAGVAVLAGMDVVLGSLVLARRTSLATYQAAQILGRLPVFVGTALSLVLFSRLAGLRRDDARPAEAVVSLFLAVSVPAAVCTATLPKFVVGVVFPHDYGDVGGILPIVAAGGLAMGFVNLSTTVFQALDRYAPAILVVWAAVLVGLPVEYVGLREDAVTGLAWAVVGIGLATSVGLLVLWRRLWGLGTGRLAARGLVAVTLSAPLVLLRGSAPAWAAWVLVAIVPSVVVALSAPHRASGRVPDRPNVLHLGYEDPRAPGAGGGSARTHEINRRLADRFDITVACAAYPGCRARVEDGVRYVHVGSRRAGSLARMSYFLVLPAVLWRSGADLIVEDFAAPVSSVAVPWLTRRPVVGMVQWLFAGEKSKQYHLPFSLVERVGLAAHRNLITVSEDLAAELRRRNPAAEVTVVANGLREDAFAASSSSGTAASGSSSCGVRRGHIGFIGRLEIAQKGLDLLLEAYALVADDIDQDLLVAGDGPDRERLADLAVSLGVEQRIHFVGRVSPEERGRWLADCDFAVVPSRYETFGMVAAEALAAGTPVVAFDIPCLSSLVTGRTGVLVAAGDVPSLGRAIRRLAADEPARRILGSEGPRSVRHLRWDDLATAQGEVYSRLIGTGPHPATPSVADVPPAAIAPGVAGGWAPARTEAVRP